MTSKLVLMGCGAVMALTQAAQGADAEALSAFLTEAYAENPRDEYQSVLTVEARPCAISITDKPEADSSKDQARHFRPTPDISPVTVIFTYRLEYVDLAAADVQRMNLKSNVKFPHSKIKVPWAGGFEALIADAQREVWRVKREMRRHFVAAGTETPESVAAENRAMERLAADVRSGKYSPYAAPATFEIRGKIRASLPESYLFSVFDTIQLTVKPGTEQAVLDALIEWRAETCTGN